MNAVLAVGSSHKRIDKSVPPLFFSMATLATSGNRVVRVFRVNMTTMKTRFHSKFETQVSVTERKKPVIYPSFSLCILTPLHIINATSNVPSMLRLTNLILGEMELELEVEVGSSQLLPGALDAGAQISVVCAGSTRRGLMWCLSNTEVSS